MSELSLTNYGAEAAVSGTFTFPTSKTFGQTHICTIPVIEA